MISKQAGWNFYQWNFHSTQTAGIVFNCGLCFSFCTAQLTCCTDEGDEWTFDLLFHGIFCLDLCIAVG